MNAKIEFGHRFHNLSKRNSERMVVDNLPLHFLPASKLTNIKSFMKIPEKNDFPDFNFSFCKKIQENQNKRHSELKINDRPNSVKGLSVENFKVKKNDTPQKRTEIPFANKPLSPLLKKIPKQPETEFPKPIIQSERFTRIPQTKKVENLRKQILNCQSSHKNTRNREDKITTVKKAVGANVNPKLVISKLVSKEPILANKIASGRNIPNNKRDFILSFRKPDLQREFQAYIKREVEILSHKKTRLPAAKLSDLGIVRRNSEWVGKKEEKLQLIRRDKIENELDLCTFKPKINRGFISWN